MPLPRLAVICDLVEENWPSMDLVAEMLLDRLRSAEPAEFEAVRVCPPFARRFSRLPVPPGRRRTVMNADRLLNRLWDYPRALRRQRQRFDYHHVCDHAYSNLVHALPRGNTGVFCHDLDTFRSLLHPEIEPRPTWFRAMARQVLRGLQKADVVFHTTSAVRSQIVKHGLLDERRLVQAPYGISPEFRPDGPEDEPARTLLPAAYAGAPMLLHVGSCIARKRLDVALQVFATLRRGFPDLRFVQVGGEWSEAHRELIARLGIGSELLQLPRLERSMIASLYRQAAVVIMPSEAEGFGLPVVEALACGSAVVASDIPVFREVGADAVTYAKLADIPDWAAAIERVLVGRGAAANETVGRGAAANETVSRGAAANETSTAGSERDSRAALDRGARLRHAARFSWKAHADTIAAAYRKL
jgi:glycosyltransferase involved in cell wall biosynthesis